MSKAREWSDRSRQRPVFEDQEHELRIKVNDDGRCDVTMGKFNVVWSEKLALRIGQWLIEHYAEPV